MDTFLIWGENIWTLCQKQYWAQRTSKVTIKAFHCAIFILLPKLGPAARTWIGWFCSPPPPANNCFHRCQDILKYPEYSLFDKNSDFFFHSDTHYDNAALEIQRKHPNFFSVFVTASVPLLISCRKNKFVNDQGAVTLDSSYTLYKYCQ